MKFSGMNGSLSKKNGKSLGLFVKYGMMTDDKFLGEAQHFF